MEQIDYSRTPRQWLNGTKILCFFFGFFLFCFVFLLSMSVLDYDYFIFQLGSANWFFFFKHARTFYSNGECFQPISFLIPTDEFLTW